MVLGVETVDKFAQFGACEVPIERLRATVVESRKVLDPILDRVEIRKVVRCEDLSLQDREVDLDLVQPACMNRQG